MGSPPALNTYAQIGQKSIEQMLENAFEDRGALQKGLW